MTKKTIDEVLSEVQQNLKVPKGQKNSFGGYKYRSCEDIMEAVKKVLPSGYSIVASDEMVMLGDRFYIKATVSLTGFGQTMATQGFAREAETKKGMDESQITGTASSYARKYAANGLFAIDDTKDADTDSFTKKTTLKEKDFLKFLEECEDDEDLNQFRMKYGNASRNIPKVLSEFKKLKTKFK